MVIIVAAGNSPPGQVPAKGQYMIKDIQHLAEYYKVPVQHMAVSVKCVDCSAGYCLQVEICYLMFIRPHLNMNPVTDI